MAAKRVRLQSASAVAPVTSRTCDPRSSVETAQVSRNPDISTWPQQGRRSLLRHLRGLQVLGPGEEVLAPSRSLGSTGSGKGRPGSPPTGPEAQKHTGGDVTGDPGCLRSCVLWAARLAVLVDGAALSPVGGVCRRAARGARPWGLELGACGR